VTRGVFGLIGAGPVGTALALVLERAGWTVGTIASRRIESAEAAVLLLGSGRATAENHLAATGADLLLLAVPDREIAIVAEQLAARNAVRPGALVLHFSGAHSSELLAPLAKGGAATGSIHPLQSFADPESAAKRLPVSFLFYEGGDPGRVRSVAKDLGGKPVPVAPENKMLYHAGAAAACNLMVSLIDVGVQLMGAAGIESEQALEALLPLISGTVRNLEEVGLPQALTGPVARGDEETLHGHLKAMAALRPDLLTPYLEASRHAIAIGLDKGSLGPEEAEKLRMLFARFASEAGR
jgi:predicted short-subunit dehydrogenase-like oxidoreductase (DUF2520 family)